MIYKNEMNTRPQRLSFIYCTKTANGEIFWLYVNRRLEKIEIRQEKIV